MTRNDEIFAKIASDLIKEGVSVIQKGVPENITKKLTRKAHTLNVDQYKPAAVGRHDNKVSDRQIRRDAIYWIDGDDETEVAWLNWTDELQSYLNQHLYLGLFSFESHFAHYSKGDFYEKHCDAFKGQANRILSVVTYLNEDWQVEQEGELLIYGNREDGDQDKVIHTVLPERGTLVIFLSEQFPHEVLPAKNDRYSIAGWFRVNASNINHIDPPR